ncbi:hypothetical protein SAMN05421810_11379 [Amycolatopsis arida]|uniref:Uncharacterized protein n=1 Tax=Amycolatopsis arida TaxID=587909 RepID=A0A1I6AM17_9PSEU|nr:hypothetical protein [Amycolatopsis arida]TDX87396.1 hypothetical protein CLV69_11379 [Amycolatopsis arida]SFQ69751.1 hypothetical protein SAMN05421810_11379 [Amycolatopsis arida]
MSPGRADRALPGHLPGATFVAGAEIPATDGMAARGGDKSISDAARSDV